MIPQKPKRKNSDVRHSPLVSILFGIMLLLIVLAVLFSMYEKSVSDRYHRANRYYWDGISEVDRGNFEAAIADFNGTIELRPDHWSAYKNRGHSYVQTEDYAAAIADFTLLIEESYGFQFDGYLGRASAYFHSGDIDAALADCEYLLQYEAGWAYNNCGYYKAATGDYVGALADYDVAFQLLPEDELAYPYNNRAYANFRLGNMETVFDDYVRSIELDPENPEVYHNRGITYYELGIEYYDLAIADYEMYAELEGQFEPFMLEQIEAMQVVLDNQ